MKPTIEQICAAFHRGANSAFKLNSEWSGGEWLNAAPEYLLTTKVCEAIGKLDGSHYVSLEYSTEATVDEAGVRGRGPLPWDMRPDGKIDILVWNGTPKPRGIIEIKSQNFGFSKLASDVRRIEKIMGRNSSIKFGGVGVYLDRGRESRKRTAKETLANALKNLEKSFSKRSKCQWRTFPSKMHGDDKDAWATLFAVTEG